MLQDMLLAQKSRNPRASGPSAARELKHHPLPALPRFQSPPSAPSCQKLRWIET
jgi:hypothetical protein